MDSMDIMIERDILLCKLIDRLGSIRGRKRFQKLMYIAKSLGYPVPEEFVWGNYGVYSSDLQWELDSLCKDGIVIERNVAAPGQDPEYEYTLAPGGRRLLDQALMLASKGETLSSPLRDADDPISAIGNNEIDALVRFVININAHSVRDLELWSSILYLRVSEKVERNLISFLRYLKPHYSEEDVRRGIADVDQLTEQSFDAVRSSRVGGLSEG